MHGDGVHGRLTVPGLGTIFCVTALGIDLEPILPYEQVSLATNDVLNDKSAFDVFYTRLIREVGSVLPQVIARRAQLREPLKFL